MEKIIRKITDDINDVLMRLGIDTELSVEDKSDDKEKKFVITSTNFMVHPMVHRSVHIECEVRIDDSTASVSIPCRVIAVCEGWDNARHTSCLARIGYIIMRVFLREDEAKYLKRTCVAI